MQEIALKIRPPIHQLGKVRTITTSKPPIGYTQDINTNEKEIQTQETVGQDRTATEESNGR